MKIEWQEHEGAVLLTYSATAVGLKWQIREGRNGVGSTGYVLGVAGVDLGWFQSSTHAKRSAEDLSYVISRGSGLNVEAP